MLAAVFALCCSRNDPWILLGAGVLGGLGGAVSLVVHELGHVRAARRLRGVNPVRISLIWLGAGTQFEGAYRRGRDQLKVAVAGPAASLAFAVVLTVCSALPVDQSLRYGIFGLALLNVAIAFASLIPVSPLDGYKLVVGLLWLVAGSERRAKRILGRTARAWIALEVLAAGIVLIENLQFGALVIAAGGLIYVQKRLSGHGRNLPKPAG